MNISNYRLEDLRELVPNIPYEKIENILKVSRNLNPDQIITILLDENQKCIKTPENSNNNIEISDEKIYTMPCNIPNCNKNCFFYHSLMERRRNRNNYAYKVLPCFNVFTKGNWDDPRNCRRGDKCLHAHTFNEVIFYSGKPNAINDFNNLKVSEPINNDIHIFVDVIRSLQKEIQIREKNLDQKKTELASLDQVINDQIAKIQTINYNIYSRCRQDKSD